MRILFITGLAIWMAAGPILAEPVPMVERHIFTPDVFAGQKEEAPVAIGAAGSALEKEILFTGVIITPKSKSAIITENTRNDKTKQKQVLKIGDQIKGMTIKEIGPNYVLIASKENSIRMNLYKGEKTRPAPVIENVKKETGPHAVGPGNVLLPGMTAGAQQPGTAGIEAAGTPPNPMPGATEKEAPSPFGGGRDDKSSQGNPGSVPNPFADLLKKGAERNPSRQGNSPVVLPFNQPAGN